MLSLDTDYRDLYGSLDTDYTNLYAKLRYGLYKSLC